VLRYDDFKLWRHPEQAAMGSDLFVGRFGLEGLETSLASHVAGLGLKFDLQRLFEAEEEVAMLCFLNDASIVAFLEHAGAVEGYPDGATAVAAFERGDSRFKNMPCWQNSIWLPFDFEPVGMLEDDPTVFVGSGPALLRELTDLQQRSPLGLGASPDGYDRMRQDIRAFYRDRTVFRLDEADTVRWIWRALFDGATIANSSACALSSTPG
jgi:hypothetical protein